MELSQTIVRVCLGFLILIIEMKNFFSSFIELNVFTDFHHIKERYKRR